MEPLVFEESEYEKQRRKNIEELEKMKALLFPKGWVKSMTDPDKKKKATVRRSHDPSLHRPHPRLLVERRRSIPRSCKTKKRKFKYDSSSDGETENDRKKQVKFEEESDDLWVADEFSDEEEGNEGSRELVRFGNWKRAKVTTPSKSPRRRVSIVKKTPVSEITEEDLLLIATCVAEKSYDQVNGTTCHQCRQKTDDMKTICRSDQCFGVRGQFCGPCLRNRYGEDAREAIMNPDWTCPPCRGSCNCSFCMKKRGRAATGIMIHVAKERGYSNVKDFLGLK